MDKFLLVVAIIFAAVVLGWVLVPLIAWWQASFGRDKHSMPSIGGGFRRRKIPPPM